MKYPKFKNILIVLMFSVDRVSAQDKCSICNKALISTDNIVTVCCHNTYHKLCYSQQKNCPDCKQQVTRVVLEHLQASAQGSQNSMLNDPEIIAAACQDIELGNVSTEPDGSELLEVEVFLLKLKAESKKTLSAN